MWIKVASQFTEDVLWEVATARSNYPPIASLHEGFAIILEEVDEFWDEVKKKPKKRDRASLYNELVQIAAMCQRTAEDLQLGDENYD